MLTSDFAKFVQAFVLDNQFAYINSKSTGLLCPDKTLGGRGCFPSPSVKFDPDILEG